MGRTLFRPKANRQELLDSIDLEIEEHSKRSKTLRDVIEKYKRKAAELVSEGMDEAAKRWLAVSLLCKQLRNNIESIMADLESARVQLLMQSDHPTSQTLEKVNQILRESVTERERTIQAINRMSFITQVGMEQTLSELEGYGIKEKAIDEEFQKLKNDLKTPQPIESKLETEKLGLPEVPKKESTQKAKKEEEAEKG